jgi:hypothetical protein
LLEAKTVFKDYPKHFHGGPGMCPEMSGVFGLATKPFSIGHWNFDNSSSAYQNGDHHFRGKLGSIGL